MPTWLELDYVLSHDGQVQVGEGGLTPYRADVQAGEVPDFTYKTVIEAIGSEKNVVLVSYSREAEAQREAFLARWKQVFSQTK